MNKFILPTAIVLASLVLGGSFYAIQINKQRSIERQQEIKRRQECHDKYKYNTIYYYDESDHLCKSKTEGKSLEDIFKE